MSDFVELTIDISQLTPKLRELSRGVSDVSTAWKQVAAGWKADTARQWSRVLSGSGGTVNDQRWQKLSDGYETRPSGKAVTSASIINQDTGQTLQAVLTQPPIIRERGTLLVLGGERALPQHGEYAMRTKGRTVYAWSRQQETQMIPRNFEGYFERLARRFNS